jgi:hypothetical protein
MRARFLAALALFFAFATADAVRAAEKASWQAISWHGEHAYAAESHGLKAVVSVDRARLVYLGSAATEHNLLFETPTRDGPNGWGGHRVWLGPQALWSWPPPAPWESRPALGALDHDGRLVVTLAPVGDGYPDMVREYYWGADGLHCNARISGGTRAVQIIHIVQVPDNARVVALKVPPTAYAPRGYVQVHLGRTPSPQPVFAPPGHATTGPGGLELHFTGAMEKFGFPLQPLHALLGDGTRMRVDHRAISGLPGATPDEGFVTQVYLGRPDGPLIELEQLSPLSQPGQPASFEIVIAVE